MCMTARYEPTSLCGVYSQLSAGDAAETRARPRYRPQHVQTSRVALETGAGLRRTVASLRDQRGLPTGNRWTFHMNCI